MLDPVFAASITDVMPSSSPRKPVNARTINERLDELFDQKDPQRYERAKETLRAIFQHGLDFSQGNPVRPVLRHLTRAIDQRLDRVKQSPTFQREGKKIREAMDTVKQRIEEERQRAKK